MKTIPFNTVRLTIQEEYRNGQQTQTVFAQYSVAHCTLEFTVYCNMVQIHCSTIQFSSHYSTLQFAAQYVAQHTVITVFSFKTLHHCPVYFFTAISEMLVSINEIKNVNINEIGCRMYDV